MNLLKLLNYKNNTIFDISAGLICLTSFIFSWIESIVNLDSYHWGTMYLQAFYLKNGLIPHKETVITYGYLTSLVHQFVISIFGEKIISIGLITGLFYAFTLALSYILFCKFLPKHWALSCVIFIFLIHCYMVYPWSNYYTYVFLLLSLILFFDKKELPVTIILSGVCIGVSFLFRYSSIVAILPPFYIYLIWKIINNNRKKVVNDFFLFNVGFVGVLILFFGFLGYHHAINDFLIQNRVIAVQWGELDRGSNPIYFRLIKSILRANKGDEPSDIRSYFFTIIFLWNLIILIYLLFKSIFNKEKLKQNENIIIAICLVSLFGYLNALHVYNVFRLINGSSIGIGVIAYNLLQISNQSNQKIKILILVPLISTCLILANSLLFVKTTSVPYPWNVNTIVKKQGVAVKDINLFKGKFVSESYYEFYHEIYQKLITLDSNYYLINLTLDPIITVITNHPTNPWLSPFHIPKMMEQYPEQAEIIKEIINSNKAILVTTEDIVIGNDRVDASGYRLIFDKTFPSDIPWLGSKRKFHVKISIPGNI